MLLDATWAHQFAGVNVHVLRSLYAKLKAEIGPRAIATAGTPEEHLLAIARQHAAIFGLDATNEAVNASVPFLRPATGA